MSPKYKVGDMVLCGPSREPLEVVEAFSTHAGCWYYSLIRPPSRRYVVTAMAEEYLMRVSPSHALSSACDCGAVKARTTHSNWCSSLRKQS